MGITINNIDVDNTIKVVKYLFALKCISTDDRLVQNVCRNLNL